MRRTYYYDILPSKGTEEVLVEVGHTTLISRSVRSQPGGLSSGTQTLRDWQVHNFQGLIADYG